MGSNDDDGQFQQHEEGHNTMSFPEEYLYTKEHEWAKIEGKNVTVGITDHAQSSLGDIVFVELPEVGTEITKGESFGTVESIKAVSDLYAPLDGKITEINSALQDNPSLLNEKPHDEAWIVKMELSNDEAKKDLMNAGDYQTFVDEQA